MMTNKDTEKANIKRQTLKAARFPLPDEMGLLTGTTLSPAEMQAFKDELRAFSKEHTIDFGRRALDLRNARSPGLRGDFKIPAVMLGKHRGVQE